MKLCKIVLILAFIYILLYSYPVLADSAKWEFFETTHFQIIYHQEVQTQAFLAASIAEEVFQDLCSFTGFKPYRKIAIIITGYDDIANGEAIPFDLIRIWVNPLNILTRVDNDWIRNVITHELTHIVQMETTFGINYWLKKMTGISTALQYPPNTFYPRWYLEGVAQYGSYRHGYDQLDRKRQMIFEQKTHNSEFYTDSELIWGRNPIGHEIVYNFGFGFFEYLMNKYGEEKFLELQILQNDYFYLGLDYTLPLVYNLGFKELMAEWQVELQERFPTHNDRSVSSRPLEKPPLAELSEPQITPKGGIIYVEKDYEHSTEKIKYWQKEKMETLLASPNLTNTRLSLANDGEKILYTAFNVIDNQVRQDLYEMTLETKQTKRLTFNQRINQGIYFQNGYLVVKNDWGKTHLYQIKGNQMIQLTETDFNFQITDLSLSPDEKKLAINFNYNGRRGIGIMNTLSWQYEKIFFPDIGLDWILGEFVDSSQILLSWDRLNHYDLYLLNIDTGECQRISNTKADIFQSQITYQNNQQIWQGLIYDSSGFTIASGDTINGETFTLYPEEIDFNDVDFTKPVVVNKGVYNHFSQLRNQYLAPYLNLTDGLGLGISQLFSDPLQELTLYYDFSWDTFNDRPLFNLDFRWKGTNPGLSFKMNSNLVKSNIVLSQFYRYYPYNFILSENFQLAESLKFTGVELNLSRAWFTEHPARTTVITGYYPANKYQQSGYRLLLQHTYDFPIGYFGDTLLTEMHLGYGTELGKIPYGGEGLLWVYPEGSLADGVISEKLTYQHNLLDLSNHISNMIQTGRLYSNFSTELTLIYNNKNLAIKEMFGIGLELETKVLNNLEINHEMTAAFNLDGDWGFKYNINIK